MYDKPDEEDGGEVIQIGSSQPLFAPKKEFVCPTCHQSFETERGMRQHVAMRHKKKKKTTKAASKPVLKDLNKNKLIQEVFPQGIPSNAECVERLSKWLQEAKALRTYF